MNGCYTFYLCYQPLSSNTSLFSVPQQELLEPEETEEEKQFKVIYQQIAGEVSTFLREGQDDTGNA